MRHGIVAAGGLLLVLTLGSWIVGSPPTTGAASSAPPVVSPTVVTSPRPSAPAVTTSAPSSVDVLSAPSPPSTPVPAPPEPDSADAFLTALNDLRAAERLPPLAHDASLDALAQPWAETLAHEGSLRHSSLIYDVIAGRWTTAGENLGYGPSVPVVFEALVASPAHLTNMVNPDFARVGIGVVWVDDVIWTTHLFAG